MNDIDQAAICLNKDYDKGIRLLAESVADKTVVGVGESTHGTHEFFQLRADLVCELIINHGFRTFALEDQESKCQGINEFIQTGEGDIEELMESLYAVWRTQEVKDLILRLKELAESYDIRFIGMDIEGSILKEETGKPMFEERDRLMADNVLEAASKGKTFVWAHNSHVSKLHLDVRNTGRNLAEKLGEQYAAIGQFFGRGSFSVRVIPGGEEIAVEDLKHLPFRPIKVSSPKKGFIEEVLGKAECQSYFIDLAGENKVGVLDREYECRAYGAVTKIEDIDKHPMRVQPYSYYDVVVYFKKSKHNAALSMKTFTSKLPVYLLTDDSAITLRCFAQEDAEVLLYIANEEAVAKYVPWAKNVKDPESSKQMITNFKSQWQQGVFARYLISENDEPCGYIGVWRDDEPGVYEVGFALLPEYRGKGVIKQVLGEVQKLAIDELEAFCLVSHIDESNESSKRAVERQGFKATDVFNDEGERRYEKRL